MVVLGTGGVGLNVIQGAVHACARPRFFAAMMVVQFFTVLLFYPETKVERATT